MTIFPNASDDISLIPSRQVTYAGCVVASYGTVHTANIGYQPTIRGVVEPFGGRGSSVSIPLVSVVRCVA